MAFFAAKNIIYKSVSFPDFKKKISLLYIHSQRNEIRKCIHFFFECKIILLLKNWYKEP